MNNFSPITGIDLKITSKCMLSCDFCVNSNGMEKNVFIHLDKIIPALQELLIAPVELAQLNAIYFTGGETIYGLNCIEKILEAIPQNIFTSIVTNGLILNDECLDKICKLNINRLKISYDTTDSKLLVNIRKGIRDNELKLIENHIRKSVETGLLVYLRVTLTKRNVRNLMEIYKKAIDLGIHTLQIKPVISSGRARNRKEIALSYNELNDAFKYLADIYDKNRVKISISCFPPARQFNLPVKNCANKDKLYLNVNGDIYMCNYVVNKFNYLGAYLVPGGMQNALQERRNRYSKLFNSNGVISDCPSIFNYDSSKV